jgi:hypothetical protein
VRRRPSTKPGLCCSQTRAQKVMLHRAYLLMEHLWMEHRAYLVMQHGAYLSHLSLLRQPLCPTTRRAQRQVPLSGRWLSSLKLKHHGMPLKPTPPPERLPMGRGEMYRICHLSYLHHHYRGPEGQATGIRLGAGGRDKA